MLKRVPKKVNKKGYEKNHVAHNYFISKLVLSIFKYIKTKRKNKNPKNYKKGDQMFQIQIRLIS